MLALVNTELSRFGAPIGAGSNADLYELNLQRPPLGADFICWSMNPQVHSSDCASIAETPEAAAQQITCARQYFPGKPLVISPITLKPRFNAVATGPEPPAPPGELPPQVDRRQTSLFGAAWTLAMLNALAEAGADVVTFFETVGWRGVMEVESGPPIPEQFPSLPGAAFPLYHVLADVGEFEGGQALAVESSHPLSIAAMALSRDRRFRLLLANLGPDPCAIALLNVPRLRQIRRLDESTVLTAMTQPESFRRRWSPFHGQSVTAPPFGLATLDG